MPGAPAPEHVAGLDLGQQQDPTALAILEKSWTPNPEPGRAGAFLSFYHVRFLKRWPLGTSYPVIVREVAGLLARPPLNHPTLAVDGTGVGRAVVDLFRQAELPADLRPILITAGHQITPGDGGWLHVPKKELVSAVQMLLQARRLKIAKLPERAVLNTELATFRVKVTVSANETFEAWRERDHDDLVLAVCLAAWMGERGGSQYAAVRRDPDAEDYLRARGHEAMMERMGRQSSADRRGLFGRTPTRPERQGWQRLPLIWDPASGEMMPPR
jgi:hypothetical protein